MGKTTVKLLGRKFQISDQLPIFIPIMRTFEFYENELRQLVINQAKSDTYTGVKEGDFAYWDDKIRSIAKKVIRDAAVNGIYDMTETELVDDNPGYAELSKVINETTLQILKRQVQAAIDYMEGADSAYSNAASNITGSGVSIWTSSFSSAMLYSFMEGNVLKKQAKQADKEYDAAIKKLESTRRSQEREAEHKAKVNIYYPGCNKAVSEIISHMFKLFLESMNNNGKLNVPEIMKYDLKKSVDITKNLSILSKNQTKEVLSKAFEYCPYNIEMYYTMIGYGYLDQDMADTLKYLTLNHLIADFYRESIAEFPNKNITRFVKDNRSLISKVCLLESKSEKDYLYSASRKYASGVIDKYQQIGKMVTSQEARTPLVVKIKNTESIENELNSMFKEIISDDDLDCLVNQCGHEEVIVKIMPEGYFGELDRKKYDRFYVDALLPLYKNEYNQRIIKEFEEKEEQKKKDEIIKENEKKKQKIKKVRQTIIIITSVAAFLGVVIFLKSYIPKKKAEKKHAKMVDAYETGDYEKAISLAKELKDDDFLKKSLNTYAVKMEGDSISKAIDIYKELNTEEARKRIDFLNKYAYIEGTYKYDYWILYYNDGSAEKKYSGASHEVYVYLKDDVFYWRQDDDYRQTAKIGSNIEYKIDDDIRVVKYLSIADKNNLSLTSKTYKKSGAREESEATKRE